MEANEKSPRAGSAWQGVYYAVMAVLILYGGAVSYLYLHTNSTKSKQITVLNTAAVQSAAKLKAAQSQIASLNTQTALHEKDSTALKTQVAALQQRIDALTQAPVGPNLVLSLTSVHSLDTVSGMTLPANQHHVFFTIAIENKGDEVGTLTFDDIQSNIKLVGSDGHSYFTEIGSGVPQTAGYQLIAPQSIAPGTKAIGSLYFILDKSITSGTLYFNSQSLPVTIS